MYVTLKIPETAELIVKKSQKISQGDELYRAQKKQAIIINLAQQLKIKPAAIFNHLVKVVGETLKKNDILAVKKGFLSKEVLRVEHDGILAAVNHHTGEITLQIDKDNHTIVYSYFTGVIHEVDKQMIKVRLEKGESFEVEDCATDWGGEVFYCRNEQNYLTVSEENVKNKVIMVEKLTPHLRAKSEALGALGFAYLIKETNTNSPRARLKKKEDYETLSAKKQKMILFSSADKIGVAYE